jgi:hypothetical protein
MRRDEAVDRLHRLGRRRAFHHDIGSDRLIQAGLDALLAGVDSPSLPLLAGLTRREEPEARALFDQVLRELGLFFEAPGDPVAARSALVHWLAGQITDGHLDPAEGALMIWHEVGWEPDRPAGLEEIVHCAVALDDWDEGWSVTRESLKRDVVAAARDLLARCPSADPPSGADGAADPA